MQTLNETIRGLLSKHAGLEMSGLGDDQDLYDAGLSSFSSVQLMLALESELDIEFPERMLNRRTFQSVASIEASVRELLPAEPQAVE